MERNGKTAGFGIAPWCEKSLLGNWSTTFPFPQKEECAPGLREDSEEVWTTMRLSPIQVPACSSADQSGVAPCSYCLMPHLPWGKPKLNAGFLHMYPPMTPLRYLLSGPYPSHWEFYHQGPDQTGIFTQKTIVFFEVCLAAGSRYVSVSWGSFQCGDYLGFFYALEKWHPVFFYLFILFPKIYNCLHGLVLLLIY